MTIPKINENCHYVQNDPHKCKIKLIKGSLTGERNPPPPPPGEIGLNFV